MNIGFIGVGVMGGHMARHILEKGYKLYVNDIRKEATLPLLAKDAIWSDTPRAMAQVCDVILSSLPGPAEMEEVVLGENGLFSGWKKGDIYIDTTTNSPVTMRKVAEKAKEVGVEVLDAPVTGGVPAAEAGALNFLVGGNRDTLEKVRGILLAAGKNIFYVGASGCGDIAKLVNNMTAFSNMAVDAEAFTLGVKVGIDPATLLNVVKASTGYNSSLNLYGMTIETGNFEPGFRLSLASKDMRLALDLAKNYDIHLPIASAVARQISQAEAAGLGEKGHQTMILQIEDGAGVQVRIDKSKVATGTPQQAKAGEPSERKTKNVGFLGTGNMGALMASHILDAGFNLFVNDIRKEATQPLLARGARWVDTPKALTQECRVILSSLPGPPEVEEVVFGKDGLFSGWQKGDIYIDTSTNSPVTMRKVAEKAKEAGVEVLDAPVSGGMPGAAAGTLTIMVGGSVSALDRVRDILQHIGKNIIHVGDSGCGDIAKLVNNTISISCTAINAEAFVLGVKAGLDASTLLEILKAGTGFNRAQEQYPRSVLKGDFEPHFKLNLACKDLGLALDLAKEYKVPMPVVGSACAPQFFKARESGFGEKDHQSVIIQLEKAAGVQVRASK